MADGIMRLGDMLVAAGLVSRDQVDWALRRQKESGKRLGEELVELGFLTEVQLTQALSNQLSLPWVSLYHVEFSRELLDLIPAEIADRHTAVPIYVRSVRADGDTLFVAMADPTNEEALTALRRVSSLPVKPMVAPPSEIRTAIRVYYFGGWRSSVPPGTEPPGSLLVSEPGSGRETAPLSSDEPTAVAPPETSAELRASSRREAAATGDVLPSSPSSSPDGPASAAGPWRGPSGRGRGTGRPEAAGPGGRDPSRDLSADLDRPTDVTAIRSMPLPSNIAARRKMVTLTLLDGTVVRLPVKGKQSDAPGAPDDGSLTATDLIAALRARAEGKDVSDVLGDAGWEELFSVLLTLLIRKGLVADWEFVDEWRRRRGPE
jgi:type IV pilus assembly protein PilB